MSGSTWCEWGCHERITALLEILATEFDGRAEVYEAHPEHDTDRYLDGYSTGMRVAALVVRDAAKGEQP